MLRYYVNMKIKNLFIIGILFFLFFSCQEKKTKSVPKVNKIKIKNIEKTTHVNILRYEDLLFTMNQDSIANILEKSKNDYTVFLGDHPSTPENIKQLKSFINYNVHQDVYKAVKKQYPNLIDLEKEFSSAFSLIKYHFADTALPKIYTTISGFNFERPIIYEDTFLIICIDMYLGPNYTYYKKLGNMVPQFIINRYSKEYIMRDCMKEMAYKYMKYNFNTSNLLEEMIIEGKRWMFVETILPKLHDSIITGYSFEKLTWAQQNESNIWAYLIDKQYLYSNDNTMIRKLIYEAPFTAYFGNTSPGQLGAWIGWQICRSWIKNNPDKKITELMNNKDSQTILKESKYKPHKKH